jgi:hypothetical protein
MKFRLFLKLATLVLYLATLRTFAQPSQSFFCRTVSLPCATETSAGTCGISRFDCMICHGSDGSTLYDPNECSLP